MIFRFSSLCIGKRLCQGGFFHKLQIELQGFGIGIGTQNQYFAAASDHDASIGLGVGIAGVGTEFLILEKAHQQPGTLEAAGADAGHITFPEFDARW